MIRWITRQLGTAPHGEIVASEYHRLDVRHLVDKAGNPVGDVEAIITAGAAELRAGKVVVVACDLGISRSNAIAAGVLSRAQGKPYDRALQEVIRATGESEIKLDMVETVRAALGETTTRNRGRNVLVTGGSGFLGQALLAGQSGPVKMLSPSRDALDLERGAVPLAEYCRANDVAQIVHLAYPRHHGDAGTTASSLLMLRSVLDTCRLLRIRLIFVSSWVVFSGYRTSGLAVDEDTTMLPKGPHGEAKYLEEQLVDLYFRRGEIRRAVCRFAAVYGPGGQRLRLIRAFYQAVQEGRPVVTHRYRNGQPALDLLFVEDAVAGLRKLIDVEGSGIFHFGTGRLTPTATIALTLAGIAGRSAEYEELAIDDDAANIALPAERAAKTLGWMPAVPIEVGLRRIVDHLSALPRSPSVTAS